MRMVIFLSIGLNVGFHEIGKSLGRVRHARLFGVFSLQCKALGRLHCLCQKLGENFGAQILLPNKWGNKEPCPRLFTYGQCRNKRCAACHGMSREPSRDQSKRFVDWVEARCSELAANPSKA